MLPLVRLPNFWHGYGMVQFNCLIFICWGVIPSCPLHERSWLKVLSSHWPFVLTAPAVLMQMFQKPYCKLGHWSRVKKKVKKKDQFTDLVYRSTERCISMTERIKLRLCDRSLSDWLYWWRKFKRDLYLHPKTGEEGKSCTWHTLAFETVILLFTSTQPSTHTVLCEQPAELLLPHCGSCFSFSKGEHVLTFWAH